MIRCRLSHLQSRCQQRGYTLDQVRACIVAENLDGTIAVDETHPAYPRKAKAGLGDLVAAGLSAIGITPERVSKAIGVKDCGCKKRQQRLNDIGRKFGIG